MSRNQGSPGRRGRSLAPFLQAEAQAGPEEAREALDRAVSPKSPKQGQTGLVFPLAGLGLLLVMAVCTLFLMRRRMA